MEELYLYIIMFIVAFVAGFIDTIAGGGGLITIPALLGAGISPHAALATNKLQSCFGSGMASWQFFRSKMLDLRALLPILFWIFFCAACGTFCVLLVPANNLKIIIALLLIVIFVYMLFKRSFGQVKGEQKLSNFAFYGLFGGLIGFYDGFLGPGTGSFWTFALVMLLGMELKSAVAHTKIFNFASNIFSFIVFAFSGNILWILGLCMGFGQMLGARLGASFVMKKEVKIIRKLLLFMIFASVCKMVFDLI